LSLDLAFMQPIAPPPLEPALAEPWSVGKLARMLRMFGPAAVLASVSIGAGETIIVVRAGAWMGYSLLWLVLLSVLVKGVCVTYFLGRYTAISGETLGNRLVRLPGPRGWILMLLVFLELAAAPPLWAAIARPSGELLGYLIWGSQTGNGSLWIATAFIAVALVLSLPTSYRALERQQIVICGLLVLGTVVGTALVRPDFVAALQGFLSFGHVPPAPASAPAEFQRSVLPLLAVTFGYVGGSVMTYLVYPDYIAVHRWGMTGHPQLPKICEQAAVGSPADYLPTDAVQVSAVRRAVGPLRWDVACGALVLLVVTASFMIAGAAVLYPRREAGEKLGTFDGWHLLTDQAEIWTAIHPTLVWVYYACVLAALWGTLQSYPDIYARGVTSYLQAIWPSREWKQRNLQLLICGYVLVTSTAMIWSDVPFNTMTQTVNFLATTLGVAIAMLAGLWLNQQLPRAYRTRWWMLAAGVASAVIMIVVSAISGLGVWEQLSATYGKA
jgi:Mn2+/Fe2+ NRAMP family transporter